MKQYIDKSALLAEINKLKGKISDGSSYCNGWQYALRMLELSLDTLKVKGVDLEKKEDVNSILERIDNEIDRLLFNNGREIDYTDVIQMIRCKISTIRNEIKPQKGE